MHPINVSRAVSTRAIIAGATPARRIHAPRSYPFHAWRARGCAAPGRHSLLFANVARAPNGAALLAARQARDPLPARRPPPLGFYAPRRAQPCCNGWSGKGQDAALPDDLLAALRGLSCADLAPDLGLVKARERGKWSCPLCGSSDGLHCYPAGRGARCYACGANADPIELARASQGLDFPGAVRWLCDRQGWPCDADQPRARSLTRPNPSPRLVAPVRAPDAPIWGEVWREREAIVLEGGDVSPEHAAQLATASLAAAVRELWLDLLRDMPRSFGYSPRVESWLERRRLPEDLALWAGWRACDSEHWLCVILDGLVPKYGEELCAAAGLLRNGAPFPNVDDGCEILVMPYWRGEAFDDAPGAVVDTLRFRIIRSDGSRQLLNMPNPDPDGWTPSNARPTWHSPSGPYLLSAAHKARQLTAPDAPLYLCEGNRIAWRCGLATPQRRQLRERARGARAGRHSSRSPLLMRPAL